jgi:hypothetical protein
MPQEAPHTVPDITRSRGAAARSISQVIGRDDQVRKGDALRDVWAPAPVRQTGLDSHHRAPRLAVVARPEGGGLEDPAWSRACECGCRAEPGALGPVASPRKAAAAGDRCIVFAMGHFVSVVGDLRRWEQPGGAVASDIATAAIAWRSIDIRERVAVGVVEARGP